MAGFTFSVEIEGEKQFSRTLLTVAEGIENFEKPLENIGKELLNTFDMNFDARGGLFGGWPPPARDYGHPLMEDSGDLRGGFAMEVQPTYVSLYNLVPYFGYHQSNAARSKLPRRVMMKIDEQRRNFIVREFQNYIRGLIGLYRV